MIFKMFQALLDLLGLLLCLDIYWCCHTFWANWICRKNLVVQLMPLEQTGATGAAGDSEILPSVKWCYWRNRYVLILLRSFTQSTDHRA